MSGTPLLELFTTDQQGGPSRYKPGQSVRFSVECLVLGILTAPNALTLEVACLEDGSHFMATVVGDSPTGNYHGDALIPLTATPGVWCRRWEATGPSIGQNALNETRFLVDPLDF